MAREIVTSENKAEYDKKKLGMKDDIKEAESMVGNKGTRYEMPGGIIDIQHKGTEYAPRKQSIVNFEVKESSRGKGIGSKLLKHALSQHDDLGGQASSPASVKVLYNHGFRHPEMPKGTFDEHEKKRQEDSSIYMAHKDANGKKYKG
jgi:GNAT superfamily N-acetyltransferase